MTLESLDDLDTSTSLAMDDSDDDDTAAFIKGVDTGSKAPSTPPPPIPVSIAAVPTPPASYEDDDGDDPSSFMETLGLSRDASVADIRKPWMENHQFVLVSSIEQLRGIIDHALKHGRIALDLETQGLDSRIDWKDGKPQTRHKIVGYCLSVDGKTGYYVPVRHKPAESVNLPNEEVEAEIRRLCLASQPKLTEEGMKRDQLASAMIAEKPQVIVYFWNAKFDQEFLFPVCGLDWWHPDSFEDGNLLYYCKYSNDKNLGLKAKSRELLSTTLEAERARKWWPHDYPEDKPKLWKSKQVPYEMIELKELFIAGRKGIHFDQLTPEEGLYYACSDAICTYLICDGDEAQKLYKDKKYANTYRLEKQVAQVVRVVERNRVKIDKAYVIELLSEAGTEAKGYETEILDIARARGYPDLDLRSSKKLSEFLFSEKWMDITPKPERNEASGQYKTDADTLESLFEKNADNAILGKLVKFRQIDKVIGTYLESLRDNCDENDQIRVQFKQTGAPTGRFSAPAGQAEHGFGGVPIHGIPATYDDKKPKVATSLRKIFIARPGYTMVKVDYAAEELRVVTNLSKEPVWIKEFMEGTGDLHSITARAFFNKPEVTKQERQQGKTANFALVYGGGAQAIVRATGCSEQEGARRKAAFDKALPIFSLWVKKQHHFVSANKGVYSAFGRWMAIPEIDSEDRMIQSAAKRYAINYPVQGAGADIMKISMVLLHKEFFRRGWIQNQDVRLLLSVHDEIVFEVRDSLMSEIVPVIVDGMTAPGRMVKDWQVPLVTEPLIGKTWDANVNWELIHHGEKKAQKEGEKLKSYEIRIGDKVYHRVPEWLESFVCPEWTGKVPTKPEPGSENRSNTSSGSDAPPPAAVVQPKPAAPASSTSPKREVFVRPIGILTKNTIKTVRLAIVDTEDEAKGHILHVVDAYGNTLVDPALNILVNPEAFSKYLRERNL